MAKLLISTQVYENYAWNEDGSIGTGSDAYWKAKGGDEYVVTGIWDEEEGEIGIPSEFVDKNILSLIS